MNASSRVALIYVIAFHLADLGALAKVYAVDQNPQRRLVEHGLVMERRAVTQVTAVADLKSDASRPG